MKIKKRLDFPWARARPGWPIVVESIKNIDIPSIMHEASHILLRKGKQNKIYEKEEILCLFIEAMFREKIYGKI